MPVRSSVHFIVRADEDVEVEVDPREASVDLDLAGVTVSITFQGGDAMTARERLRDSAIRFARTIVEATVDPISSQARLRITDLVAATPIDPVDRMAEPYFAAMDHPSYGGLGQTPEGATEISGMTYKEFWDLARTTNMMEPVDWYWRGFHVHPPSLDLPGDGARDPRVVLSLTVGGTSAHPAHAFSGRIGPGPDGTEERIP